MEKQFKFCPILKDFWNGAATFSITTLGTTTLSIMTLRIKGLLQHSAWISICATTLFIECHYAECRDFFIVMLCCCAEFSSTDCRYAECRIAFETSVWMAIHKTSYVLLTFILQVSKLQLIAWVTFLRLLVAVSNFLCLILIK